MTSWRHRFVVTACALWIASGGMVSAGVVSAGSAETTLVIATGEYPPFVSVNPEENMLGDLFQEIGKEMGVTFKFEFMPWKRCEARLQDLTAWGAIPFGRSPEREAKYFFSDPLYLQPVVFFAYDRDGGNKTIPFEELADLKGYRIGVTLGYFYEKTLKDAGLDVVSVASEDQNFLMLQKGRVDVAPIGEASGWYRIGKLFPPEEAAKFHTLDKPLMAGGEGHLITSKQYPDTRELLERFNRALAMTRERGTYRKLFERYLPDVKDIM